MPISDEAIRASILREVEKAGPPPDLWERVQRGLSTAPRRAWAGRVALAAGVALGLLVALPGPRTTGLEWVRAILLPDGREISWDGPTALEHSTVEVQVIGVRKMGDPVAGAIGNHAQILSREEVTIPAGRAILALVERTPPAASRERWVKHEYWLIVLRPYPQREEMLLAYALVATVTGDVRAARDELLRVARHWEIP